MSRLAPAVSVPARQTMRAAFEDLERTITPADSRTLCSASTLQQVRAAAVEIENRLAAKGSLRNMRRLAPLFRGLEHYAKVVDVLCNGTPYLSWIWAPITLVLRISSEYVEAFEQLMKGYSRIAACLTRFELLSDAFITDPDFQQTLAVFYADILQFHKHAYKFVRRSGWRLLFLTSWGRFQRRFENILDDLKRHGELIDLEANARNIAEARQMRQDIRTWREESLDQVRRNDEESAAKHYRSVMSWLRFDESEQLSVFGSVLEEGSKFPGTCAWIVQHPMVRAWLQRRPDTPFVWLQGHPGTGKSVISGQLVNFIQAQTLFVVCHFSTYSYLPSTKYEYIVKSLLLQLLRTNGESLAYVYQECVLGKKPPSITTLEKLLHLITLNLADEPGEVRYLWIVLDGLDECEVDKQPRLLSLVKYITTKSTSDEGTVCKVLVSSRYSAVLFKHLRKWQIISLSDESHQLNKAIRNYTIQRLQSSAERLHQLELEPEDVEDVASAIALKADGMFLYARLVLDYLTTNIFYSRDELKESIYQLPQTLFDFYHKILTQILARLDSRSVDRIKMIFSWIAFARRPLKRFELLSAISFSLGDPSVERPAPPYILDICSPLVGERGDTTLVFIHVSVKEFLQSSSLGLDERQALNDHGIAAVTCLLSGLQVFDGAFNKQTKLIRLIRGVYGLHVYATEFWTEYLLSEAEATGGPDISSPFLAMAFRLANRLDEAAATTASMECIAADDDDKRLLLFQGHEVLYKHIRAALGSRSRKRLEMELLSGADGNSRISCALLPLDGISRMLQSYQSAIEMLLNEDFHPGVSAEELETFKNQFRTSAYTCHLRSCPRATTGFETDLLRYEHEMAHTGGFRCICSDCQYPPFSSSKALKAHMRSCHKIVPERKSIRRVGALSAPHSSIIWNPYPTHPKERMMNLNQHQQNLDFGFAAPADQRVEALRIRGQGQQVISANNSANPNQMTGFPKSSPIVSSKRRRSTTPIAPNTTKLEDDINGNMDIFDRKRQLKLLEQRNKQRILMAQQKQINIANLNQMTGFPGNVKPSPIVSSKHQQGTTPIATNTTKLEDDINGNMNLPDRQLQFMQLERLEKLEQLKIRLSMPLQKQDNSANVNQMTGFPGNVEPSPTVSSKHQQGTTPIATNTTKLEGHSSVGEDISGLKLQLMLLEQKSEKLILMARQKQANIANLNQMTGFPGNVKPSPIVSSKHQQGTTPIATNTTKLEGHSSVGEDISGLKLQLMLLEQKSEKLILMARQKQANIANLNQMTGFPGNVKPSPIVSSKHQQGTTPIATNTTKLEGHSSVGEDISDLKLQLMLLEQKNKKQILMARQKQTNPYSFDDQNPSNPQDIHQTSQTAASPGNETPSLKKSLDP
ncbi:MAG: hypothetical protein M1840_004899 [Geoglossum simile]|nr:MAG: hypothetical protein M1840_004899 [Geoglossum simile]